MGHQAFDSIRVANCEHAIDPHRAGLRDGHHLLRRSTGVDEVIEIHALRWVEPALSWKLRPGTGRAEVAAARRIQRVAKEPIDLTVVNRRLHRILASHVGVQDWLSNRYRRANGDTVLVNSSSSE